LLLSAGRAALIDISWRSSSGLAKFVNTGDGTSVEREKKIIHRKANNQFYKQNELMWQAAREEIPI